MVASYLGYIWWDNETDGEYMYPEKQHNPTDEERYQSWLANPEAAAARGKWKDLDFLEKIGTPEFNAQLKHTQFADFHGHGWVFRAVYKRDRKGNLLDAEDNIVPPDDKDKFQKAVHLKDIHLEKGMHCADCHFAQDNHGNGNLYGETRNAVEIDCVDCHGTISKKATLENFGGGRSPGRQRSRAAAHSVAAAAILLAGRQALPALRWWSKNRDAMGSGAGDGHHHAGQSALQRDIASGEDDPEGWPNVGRGERPTNRSWRTPTAA